jgi:hypothetical protein
MMKKRREPCRKSRKWPLGAPICRHLYKKLIISVEYPATWLRKQYIRTMEDGLYYGQMPCTRRNRSPAPHFRPIKPPRIANYSSEACLNEPGALDERLQIGVMQSFGVYRWTITTRPIPIGGSPTYWVRNSGRMQCWSIGLASVDGYESHEEPCTDPYARFSGQTGASAPSGPI